MQKTIRTFVLPVVVFALFISGCSGSGTSAGSPAAGQKQAGTQPAIVLLGTQNGDPCASMEGKKPEIDKITRTMDEFDDNSFLIQAIKNPDQLVQVILVMQRVRRDAINNTPPECLKQLRDAQVNYMNAVVLISINIANRTKSDIIQRQVVDVRKIREEFDKELANLLGLKYETITPMPTIPPTPVLPTSTVAPISATTIQDRDIFVLQGPGLNFPAVGTFLKGQVANVLGRSEKGDWIEIDVPSNPGNAGWVPKELIKLSSAEASVPIVTPPPAPQPTAAQ